MTRQAIVPLGLRRDEVSSLVGLSNATVHRLVARGEFPPPRKLGERSVCFIRSEVEAWLAARPVSDILPPPQRSACAAAR